MIVSVYRYPSTIFNINLSETYIQTLTMYHCIVHRVTLLKAERLPQIPFILYFFCLCALFFSVK